LIAPGHLSLVEIGVSIALAVYLVLLLAVAYIYWKPRKHPENERIPEFIALSEYE
jgi:hypothetical protein